MTVISAAIDAVPLQRVIIISHCRFCHGKGWLESVAGQLRITWPCDECRPNPVLVGVLAK